MENEHTLSGLVRKRAEIAGELEAAQMRVRQRVIDADNAGAMIRLFGPDIDLEEIRPKPVPPRHTTFHGEISRAILTAMRGTEGGLTTRDLTLIVMRDRDLNAADPRLFRIVQKRVGASLRRLRRTGETIDGGGHTGDRYLRVRQDQSWSFPRMVHACRPTRDWRAYVTGGGVGLGE